MTPTNQTSAGSWAIAKLQRSFEKRETFRLHASPAFFFLPQPKEKLRRFW